MSKEYSLILGRFQVPMPHRGHFALIDKVLSEGRRVVIALRKEDGTDSNPFTQAQRTVAFEAFYKEEIAEGRMIIINVPNIVEVVYGRTPGWEVRKVSAPRASNVSGTAIREDGGHRIYWITGNSGAGKTTIANELLGPLNAVNLDGDEMRASISLGAGFSIEERLAHNIRVARLAKQLVKYRNVVVSVIAPTESIRNSVEDAMAPTRPWWIYLDRNLSPREGYPYESPQGRERCMTILNTPGIWTPAQVAARILAEIKKL
ncbi:hypothetical protein LCGC14_0275300 [marine sediment metagenome]|uniref:APS kinase domain-containing protein n=1 Tax=marine sediment metagenome TaxID=412755 RepID=A0A0F9TXG0_9ZZZZ